MSRKGVNIKKGWSRDRCDEVLINASFFLCERKKGRLLGISLAV